MSLRIISGINIVTNSDNVIDGMIMFPATGVFTDFGGIGVSMFFVTWVIPPISIHSRIY